MKLKRIVAVALTLTMTAAMSACSSNDGTDRSDMETSGSVGFSVSTLNNPFFVTLVDGAKATAEENGVEVDCKIASDNVAGAKMATEYLLELVGKGAEVAELQGVPGASAIIDRGEGFHEVADKDLDVVASQTANFNRAEGLDVMENILQASGDLKGVFAHNDEMTLGAAETISASGKDIKIVGFDATDDAVAAVKEVKMAATVAQQPEKMGITAVETAIKLMAGEMVEKSIPVEVKLITE